MGSEAGLVVSGFNREISEALGLVEPAEQKASASQRLVGPTAMTSDSARRMKLQEPLTLSHPVQCFFGLAGLPGTLILGSEVRGPRQLPKNQTFSLR